MNKIQRWILIIGATIMAVVIFMLPKVRHFADGKILKAGDGANTHANIVDIRSAAAYGLTILVVILMFYFAFSSGKNKTTDD